MSYNPVAEATSNVSAAFQAEGVKYGELYASQGRVHIEASWSLWVAIALFLLVIANGTIEGRPWSRWLHKTSCFGIDIHTSRAQFLVLVVYLIYITVSSFANIPYGHSYRYVSHHAPGFVQKATTLQFIANRTGFLAFASVPLTFMLVARVGVVQIVILSYHQLNFLHRWVGWTVLILSWVHAVLWTVEMGLHSHIEGGYLATRWHKRYWIGGCFAILFLSYVTLHSFPTIRRLTGYEFFRITHKLGAILFLIGCWVHWPEAFQWIAGALAIYLFDKLWKYSWYVVKYRKAGGKTTLCGKVSTDADGASVAIITISNTGIGRWQPGQHVYLSCITLGEWQSHPFSVANTGQNTNEMLLIVREKSGMTRKLLDHLSSTTEPVTVMLDGPFGFFRYDYLFNSNILLIVGGTGISFALSVLDYFSKQDRDRYATVKLVWYIRRAEHIEWVRSRLESLYLQIGHPIEIECLVSRSLVPEVPGNKASTISPAIDCPTSAGDITQNQSILIKQRTQENLIAHFIQLASITSQPSERLAILGCGPDNMGHEIEKEVDQLNQKSVYSYIERYEV